VKPDSAADIVRTLRQHGYEAYFVGGCVRDMVLGLEPSDYDIATSARPEDVARIFPRTEPVGAKFGVMLVICRGHPFEVATFRSDEAYIDGRRPVGVVFTDAQQDVLRRDFTINGLLYDPISNDILDYVSGMDDIRAKVVRAIGAPDKRFEEDKLRILRAIRFGARLGYTIEPSTWDAVRRMAGDIHQVSKERVREELVRILTEGNASHGVRMLQESGLRREILPELDWSEHLDRSLTLLKRGSPGDFAMAVLLHHTSPGEIAAVVQRLKFSRAEMHHILALAETLPKFAVVQNMSSAQLKRFLRLPRLEDHLELARIHAVAGDGDLSGHSYASRKYTEWTLNEIAPVPLLTGDDLIEIGYHPGPVFKEILMLVEDEQLEGRLTSHQAAIDFVRTHYGKENHS